MYAFVLAFALVAGQPGYTGAVWVRTADCPACQKMEPTINKLLIEGMPIVVVGVTNQAQLAPYDNHGLVPVTLVYRDGKVVNRFIGYMGEPQLRKLLTDVKKKE